MGILYIFLVLQSHHYIGVFRTASLIKRDIEKEDKCQKNINFMNQQLSHFCWQMANRNKTMNGQEKNFVLSKKRLIYIWFCDVSELSFLWLVVQFVFLAFLRLGFDFILQLYVCICLVSFSAQVVFFRERQSSCVSLFDFSP